MSHPVSRSSTPNARGITPTGGRCARSRWQGAACRRRHAARGPVAIGRRRARRSCSTIHVSRTHAPACARRRVQISASGRALRGRGRGSTGATARPPRSSAARARARGATRHHPRRASALVRSRRAVAPQCSSYVRVIQVVAPAGRRARRGGRRHREEGGPRALHEASSLGARSSRFKRDPASIARSRISSCWRARSPARRRQRPACSARRRGTSSSTDRRLADGLQPKLRGARRGGERCDQKSARPNPSRWTCTRGGGDRPGPAHAAVDAACFRGTISTARHLRASRCGCRRFPRSEGTSSSGLLAGRLGPSAPPLSPALDARAGAAKPGALQRCASCRTVVRWLRDALPIGRRRCSRRSTCSAWLIRARAI